VTRHPGQPILVSDSMYSSGNENEMSLLSASPPASIPTHETSATPKADSKLQYALLSSVVFLALVLRLYRLGEWSFWIDEIFTINRAQAHYGSLELMVQHVPPMVSWLPLSFLFTGGTLSILGVNEWSARVIPAAIGVLSIPVLYFPIRHLLGAKVAIIAVLLLAVSPWHIYWSQNARFYSSLMLLYTLSLFAFYYGLERDRPRYLLAGMLLLYLAASERVFAALLVPTIVCYLISLYVLRFDRPLGFRPRNLLLLAVPVLAAGALEAESHIVGGTPVS
jgi:mannosyltransferase